MSSSQPPSIHDTLKLAVSRHEAGDLREAERLYRLVLQANPAQPDANHNLGTLARQLGQDAAALPYLEAALRANPAYEPYALAYAETLINCNRFDEAIGTLEVARRRGMGSVILQELLAHAQASALTMAGIRDMLSEDERDRIVAMFRREQYAELEPLLGALLARRPEAGFLWKLHSIGLARQGKDARHGFERAAALLPHDVEAQRNLAHYLAQGGHWQAAAEAAQRVCALDPAGGAARASLADAMRELGRLGEAIAHYRHALELDPTLLDAHNNLGNVLKNAGMPEEAEASYRRAIALKPDCAEAWCNLGLLLKSLARNAEAAQACRNAREAAPMLAGAMVLAGDLAIDDGRFAEAEALFRQAITGAPHMPEAWAGIARTRKMTLQDEPWASGAAALADSGLPPHLEVFLRFALGKYFDDTQQYDAAFAQYHRANELNKLALRSRGQADYQQGVHGSFIDGLIRQFGGAGAAQAHPAGTSALPVFIIGMPRSGTTLAEQILASHPAVYGAGELLLWNKEMTQYRQDAQKPCDTGALLGGIGARVLQQLQALAPHAGRVVDKMPNNFLHVGLIHAVFPNARFIHMRRNPLDVCLSIYFNSFAGSQRYACDLHHLAHYYREYERLMAHWRAALPEGTMLDVPYEALVQEQEAWSRRMVEFIGLPWDERCLRFHENARAVHTPSNWQVRQQITKASVERWRNYEKFVGPLAGLLQPAA